MKNLIVNWKTTGVAVLFAVLGILNILYPATFTTDLNLKIGGILTLLGFGAAKDGAVSGIGSKATTDPSKQ
jgi:hypothetical protein